MNEPNDPSCRYRVWIAASGNWRPQNYSDVPPDAVALEPAEKGTMSARQAARYVQAFNRTALARRPKIRAVALPVTVQYQGEPRPGQRLADAAADVPRQASRESPPSACQVPAHGGAPFPPNA